MTISDQVARHARKTGDQVALTFGDTSLTWTQLDERAGQLASALGTRGVGTGDRVAILALNCLEYVEVMVACARIGVILLP